MIKLLVFFIKLPPIIKISMVGVLALAASTFTGIDYKTAAEFYAIFILVSSIVTGMPEPDTQLSGWRFYYTWLYRSSHLLVASATAYFMHSKQWKDISGGAPLVPAPSTADNATFSTQGDK